MCTLYTAHNTPGHDTAQKYLLHSLVVFQRFSFQRFPNQILGQWLVESMSIVEPVLQHFLQYLCH